MKKNDIFVNGKLNMELLDENKWLFHKFNRNKYKIFATNKTNTSSLKNKMFNKVVVNWQTIVN